MMPVFSRRPARTPATAVRRPNRKATDRVRDQTRGPPLRQSWAGLVTGSYESRLRRLWIERFAAEG